MGLSGNLTITLTGSGLGSMLGWGIGVLGVERGEDLNGGELMGDSEGCGIILGKGLGFRFGLIPGDRKSRFFHRLSMS